MISAGNDIVSFDAIDIARTNNPKFYSKFLSETERSLYQQQGLESIQFESFVWLLWSVKEAAYKYLKRLAPTLVFTPIKFAINNLQCLPNGYSDNLSYDANGFFNDNNDQIIGTVIFNGALLHFQSNINTLFVHSIVNTTADFSTILCGVQQITGADPSQQSAEVRAFLENRLKLAYNVQHVAIIKSPEDIPTALIGKNEVPVPVSLSHHSRMIAYSFCKTAFRP